MSLDAHPGLLPLPGVFRGPCEVDPHQLFFPVVWPSPASVWVAPHLPHFCRCLGERLLVRARSRAYILTKFRHVQRVHHTMTLAIDVSGAAARPNPSARAEQSSRRCRRSPGPVPTGTFSNLTHGMSPFSRIRLHRFTPLIRLVLVALTGSCSSRAGASSYADRRRSGIR